MEKKITAFFVFLVLVVMAVYAATGKKYHERSCRTLVHSKTVTELTVEQAKASGYEPCKVCNPVRNIKAGE